MFCCPSYDYDMDTKLFKKWKKSWLLICYETNGHAHCNGIFHLNLSLVKLDSSSPFSDARTLMICFVLLLCKLYDCAAFVLTYLSIITEGHGPVKGETPPPGYVCRSCGVPGHFIQHCQQERKTPSGYVCYRCRIPGHFIHHCPTIGDPKFDDYKKPHTLVPEVSACPIDGIPSALAPAASVSVVDDLPAELHCRLCNKVMADAVLTSKCCFDSFCDKCE
jgi:hypothetical protein